MVDGLHRALMPLLSGHRLPPALRDPRQWQLRYGGVVLAMHWQPSCSCPAMLSYKGDGLFQGRIRTGGGGVQELQDIQEQLPVGPEKRP